MLSTPPAVCARVLSGLGLDGGDLRLGACRRRPRRRRHLCRPHPSALLRLRSGARHLHRAHHRLARLSPPARRFCCWLSGMFAHAACANGGGRRHDARPIHHRGLRLCRTASITCSSCCRHLRPDRLPRHRLIVVFLRALLPRLEHAARRSPGAQGREIEIGWTVATLFPVPVPFLVGGIATSSPRSRRRKDALEIHVVAKQWMWRIQHPSGAREIDELHVPAEHQRAAGDDVARRHSRSLFAGAAAQAGHPARPLHLSVVQRQQDRHLPSHLRRVLRHRPLRHGRALGDRHAAGLCALDRRAAARRRSRPSGRSAVPLARMLRLPHARARPCTRRICTAFTDSPCSSPMAAP